MRKKYFTFLMMSGLMLPAFFTGKTSVAQSNPDTLAGNVITLRDRVSGIEDRVATAESDLAKLTKIKLSGYVQAQWQDFENPSTYPSNYFSIRRARFKVQYEPANGVAFVLQPDFQPSNFVIKEAYARLNDRWLKMFSLWAGKFSRPNYEVEYSSSDLELLERSRVITSLYPGEYAIGAKLEFTPPKVPLKFQLAVFNGNDNMTIKDASGNNINPDNTDFDNGKDIMARLTYAFRLGKWGGLTIGAHGYYGYLKATSDTLLKSDYTVDKSIKVGQSFNRNWFGVEAQFYIDVLGGLTLKGEYITGVNGTPGYSSTTSATNPTTFAFNKTNDTLTMSTVTNKTTLYHPNMLRNFSGYYVYLIKNVGKRNQFAARYDYYDPNTKLSGGDIGIIGYGKSATTTTTTSFVSAGDPVIINKTITNTIKNTSLKSGTADLAYGELALSWTYFFDDNLKISLEYELPMNEKVGTNAQGVGNVTSSYTVNNIPGTIDYSKVFPQNVITLRIQAKF